VKLLIKHGANVNQKDRLNLSALSYACMLCHTELCIELIINGCKCIWSMAWSYCSPLEFLLQKKEYKIVKYLIESGYCLSKNEKWLMDSTYSVKKIDKNALNWVKMNLKNPKTLMNICRQEIRKRLGNEYVNEKISCLNVTYNVKQYLLMRS
jgi:ankyrin repeat protein